MLSILIPATLLLTAGVFAPMARANGSNITIVWTSTQLHVVIPSASWAVVDDNQKIGCAGTVKLTLPNGAQQTVVGVGLGGSCATTPPCTPYSLLNPPITCSSSNLVSPVYVTIPANANANVTSLEVGCLKEFFVDVDVDGDGQVDSHNGPLYGFAGCSW